MTLYFKDIELERIIIEHPKLMVLGWLFLNVLYCCVSFLLRRLYKKKGWDDSRSVTKITKKSLLRFLVWLVFGVVVLVGCGQKYSQGKMTINAYSDYVGAFYFLIIGYLLTVVQSFIKYLFCWRKMSEMNFTSSKESSILHSIDFFGYSAFVLLCFLVSGNRFLLGGAWGLAIGAVILLVDMSDERVGDKCGKSE